MADGDEEQAVGELDAGTEVEEVEAAAEVEELDPETELEELEVAPPDVEGQLLETTELLPNGEILTRQTVTHPGGERQTTYSRVAGPGGDVSYMRYDVTVRAPRDEAGALGEVQHTLVVDATRTEQGQFDQTTYLENDNGVSEIDQGLLDSIAAVELDPETNPLSSETATVVTTDGEVYETTTVRDAFTGDAFATSELLDQSEIPEAVADPALNEDLTLLSSDETRARATAVRDALLGAGTSEVELFQAIDGLEPHQLEQVIESYNGYYGESLGVSADLVGDVIAEFQGSGADVYSLGRAEALFAGDQVLADVHAISWATHGTGFTHEATIQQVLEGRDASQIQELRERHAEVFPDRPPLDDVVLSDLSLVERQNAEHLLAGDTPRGNAIVDYRLGGGDRVDPATADARVAAGLAATDFESYPQADQLIARVESYSELTVEERQAYDEVFEEMHGVTFGDFLAERLTGPDANLATSLWTGDEIGVLSAQRERALYSVHYSGPADEAAFRDLPGFESPEQREAVEARFQESHPAGLGLAEAITEQFRGFVEEEFLARHNGDNLRAAAAQALVATRQDGLANSGLGTNEELLREAAAELSRYGPAEVSRTLSELTGQEITLDLLDRQESRGGDHYVQQSLRPPPADEGERLERALEDIRYELSGFGGAFGGADRRDLVQREGRLLETLELTELDGLRSVPEAELIENEVAFAGADIQRVQEARERASGIAKDVATGVVLTALSFGSAIPAAVGGAVVRALGATVFRQAATAGATRALTGLAFTPEGFEPENVVQDFITGGADALGGRLAEQGFRSILTVDVPSSVTDPLFGRSAQFGLDTAEAIGGGAFGNGVDTFLSSGTWDSGIADGIRSIIQSATEGALIEGSLGSAFSGITSSFGRLLEPGFDRRGPDLSAEDIQARAEFHTQNPRAAEIQLEAAERARVVSQDLRAATTDLERQALLERYIAQEIPFARELDLLSPGGLLPPGSGRVVAEGRVPSVQHILELVRQTSIGPDGVARGPLGLDEARRLVRGALADSDPWGPVALNRFHLGDRLARAFEGNNIAGNYFGFPDIRGRSEAGHLAASALPLTNRANRFVEAPTFGVELGIVSRVGEKIEEFGPHAIGGGWQVVLGNSAEFLRSLRGLL